MSLKIITKRCKGCGICAAFCPKKVLAVSEVGKVEAVAPMRPLSTPCLPAMQISLLLQIRWTTQILHLHPYFIRIIA